MLDRKGFCIVFAARHCHSFASHRPPNLSQRRLFVLSPAMQCAPCKRRARGNIAVQGNTTRLRLMRGLLCFCLTLAVIGFSQFAASFEEKKRRGNGQRTNRTRP